MPAPIAAEHSSAVVSNDIAVCSRSTYTASYPAAAASHGTSAERAWVSAMHSTSSPASIRVRIEGSSSFMLPPSLPFCARRDLDPAQRVLEDPGVTLGRRPPDPGDGVDVGRF